MLAVQYYVPTILGVDIINVLMDDQSSNVGIAAWYPWGSKRLMQEIQLLKYI